MVPERLHPVHDRQFKKAEQPNSDICLSTNAGNVICGWATNTYGEFTLPFIVEDFICGSDKIIDGDFHAL